MKEQYNKTADSPSPDEPVLLVQCCDLPQFLFMGAKLHSQGLSLHALLRDEESCDYCRTNSSCFSEILNLEQGGKQLLSRYSQAVLPRLNRGYWQVRRLFASFQGELWQIDYEGRLRRRAGRHLLVPGVRRPPRPTEEFVRFLEALPERSLGRRVLILESCHPSLVEKTRVKLQQALPQDAEVIRVSEGQVPPLSQLRGKSYDTAVVFFSGERGFSRLKRIAFLVRARRLLAIDEHGYRFEVGPRTLARFLYHRFRHGYSPPEPAPQLLFIQTEAPEYVIEACRILRRQDTMTFSEMVVLCRKEDLNRFQEEGLADRFLTFPRNGFRQRWRLLRQVRDLRPDYVSAIFSGRSVFRKHKLLFLTFLDRPQLVFNAALDCYWLSIRTIPRLWRKDAPLFEVSRPEGSRIVFIQTEESRYVRLALEKLNSQKLFPKADILLLCRSDDRPRLQSCPGVSKILAFSAKTRVLDVLREIRLFSPEVVSTIFAGRAGFRKQKTLALVLAHLPRLVFNARLDAYWLSPRTLPRLFRREPLLFDDSPPRQEVLLIQTDDDRNTLEAISILLSGKVVPNRTISVLCSRAKRRMFEKLSTVDKVYTYAPGHFGANLALLRQLVRQDRDVVSALLTGRSTFRIQKLLFFLLPSRHRLVFNKNLDCFYLKRGRLSQAFRLPTLVAPQFRLRLGPLLRLSTRAILFLPRLLYLLAWLTFAKLRRSQCLQSDANYSGQQKSWSFK